MSRSETNVPPSPIRTQLDVIAALQRLGLRGRTLTDAQSAVRTVARAISGKPAPITDADLALIPIEPANLELVLNEKRLTLIGLQSKSARQTASRARGAYRAVGIELRDGRGRTSISDAWNIQLSVVPKGQRRDLFMFAAWCSECGVDPTSVSNSVIQKYRAYRLKEKNRGSAGTRSHVNRIVGEWNKNIAIEQRSSRRLTPINARRNQYGKLYMTAVSPAIEREIEGWIKLVQRQDKSTPLSVPGLKLKNKTSAANDRGVLLRAVSAYCAASGVPPHSIQSLSTLADPSAMELVVDFMMTRVRAREADAMRSEGVYQTLRLISNVARYQLRVPSTIQQRLDVLAHSHSPAEIDVRSQNKVFLKHFLKPWRVKKFLTLAINVFEEVRAKSTLNAKDRNTIKMALALQLAQNAPAWPINLSSAVIGENIVEVWTDGERQLWAHWTAEDARYGKQLNYRLDDETIALYDYYRKKVLKASPVSGKIFLFPGRARRAMNPSAFSAALVRITAAHLKLTPAIHDSSRSKSGIRLNIQKLRCVLAFLSLIWAKNDAWSTSDLLGHSRSKSIAPLIALIGDWEAQGLLQDIIALRDAETPA